MDCSCGVLILCRDDDYRDECGIAIRHLGLGVTETYEPSFVIPLLEQEPHASALLVVPDPVDAEFNARSHSAAEAALAMGTRVVVMADDDTSASTARLAGWCWVQASRGSEALHKAFRGMWSRA